MEEEWGSKQKEEGSRHCGRGTRDKMYSERVELGKIGYHFSQAAEDPKTSPLSLPPSPPLSPPLSLCFKGREGKGGYASTAFQERFHL